MRRIKKRLLAWLMAVAMVFGVIHVSPAVVVQAEGETGITFGAPKFNSGRTEYTFPDVTVQMSDGADKQKIFCISVSDGGSFKADFSDLLTVVDISGVRLDGKYVDNSGNDGVTALQNTDDLISITVLGSISDDAIKNFIKNMVFSRNVTDPILPQKVSAVSSAYDVRADGATALAIDGELHIYKYIDWETNQIQRYVGSDPVTVDKSEVSEDARQWTWFNAYKLAKKQKANGLKGYLTTITSDEEQQFIFNKFGAIRDTAWNKDGAWIGGARTFVNGESANASSVIFDADTMDELYPDNGSGTRAALWRWMCGPESKDAAARTFYTLTSTGYHENDGTINTYAAWNDSEPNNHNSNKYDQEFCLQYGYTNDGKWNDWGPEHSPQSYAYAGETGSGETGSGNAPAGFIVEFSPYDIDGDGEEDEGEIPTTTVEKDFTIITAQPNIITATLDKTSFKLGEPISVTSILGDNTVDGAGNPTDELLDEEDKNVPECQWQIYNETTGKWDNATGAGNNTTTYTPVASDAGKKLRVYIKATDNAANNPKGYLGGIYVDADNSDDLSDKVEGTIVEAPNATVSGYDFIIPRDVSKNATDAIVKTYSSASATIDGTTATDVKEVTDDEITMLKKLARDMSMDIVLVNSLNSDVKTTVKATIYDNASGPQEKDGKICQIGSNNFSVPGGSAAPVVTADDILNKGKVTSLEDGTVVGSFTLDKGRYEVNAGDLANLNTQVANNADTTVTVNVTDNKTGLVTPVKVKVIPDYAVELASGTLNPFKDDHGEDLSKDPEHYCAGQTIAVDKLTLNNGVEYTSIADLTGKFNYKWQISDGKKYIGDVESNETGATQKWTDIEGAKSNQLTADQTKAIAGNKIRVIVTAKDGSGINNPPVLFIDGDGSSTADTEEAKGAGGTFVDLFTIDASDFVVSLDDAKTMTTAQAVTAAGTVTEFVNKNKPETIDAVKTSDVASGLNNVSAPGVAPVKFTSDISVDSTTISAVDKDDTSKLGKQVNAYIKDSAHTETLEDGTKLGIGANNITISLATAKTLVEAKNNAEQAKALSSDAADRASIVVVDNGTTLKASELNYIEGANPKVTITYDDEKPFVAAVDTYKVTYSYTNSAGKSTSTEATIKVVSNSEVKASDFIISVNDAKTATEDNVKDRSNASGKDDDGNAVTKNNLDVKDSDMTSLNGVDKPNDISVQIINTSTDTKPVTTVKAHVVDETGIDDTKKITIGANNFDMYPEDVQKVKNGDPELLKKFADVIASDNGVIIPYDNAGITVTPASITGLSETPGLYDVTFTYNGVEVTVKANVKVPSIDAHDFIISTTDAKSATEVGIKTLSGASGVDGDSNQVDKSKLDIDDSAVDAIKEAGNNKTPKDIPVKVTNTNNSPYPSKTVTAHVVDETKDNKSTEDDPAKQITIGANNFFISPEDAQKAIDGDDAILKTLSEVLAIEGYKDVPVTNITVSDKSKLKTTDGVYDVSFAYNGVSVTVKATVKTTDASKSTIDAHDIIISIDDVKDVTEDSIKTSSDVTGKNQFDNPLKPSEVDVKDDDVTTIKNTTTPDQLTVELTNTTGSQPTTTIDVYVVDETATNGNNDPAKKITIGANNFDISVDDAQKAIDGDDPILRQLSAVVAVAGGVNVKTSDIKVSDKSKLKAEPGKYPVTFSYTKDGDTVEVTVDATVKANSGSKDPANKDDNNKDNGDGEQITGNDFTVKGGSTPLTPKDIIDKGNVDAVDGNGTPIVLPPDSSVKKEDLDKLNDAIKDGKKGTYPVVVTTPKGTSVTVIVTVTDENDSSMPTDPTKPGETIAANNFKIGVNDFDKIFGDPTKKDEIVKKLSNAEAYDTELKTPVEITSVDTTNVKGEPGVYPVTLTTANGTSTTINVTVDGEWDTIGDVDKASDANKEKETVDNDTAKKIVPVVTPTPMGTGGTSQPVNPEDIVYEKTNPQDKTEPIDPSKQVPPTGALTINGVPVDQYTVSPDGTKLIISKDYLNTLPKGSYPAVLTYADGTTQQFNVTIVDYDETTLVKNPPLFSMYKEIVLKKKNTFTINLKGITKYAVVTSKITGKGKKAKSIVKIKQQKNGDVLITPKKVGKTQVTCTIIQNGAEYKVVVDLKVLRQYKGTSKNYNLKTKGLVKTSGELPEFNVYKRIVKGKNTKIKFTKVATDAKVKFYVKNKKEAKSLKIGKIKRKGKTATCTIKGKKKGWVHLTAEITQNGKTYYTRLLVRIDDGTWTKKQIKKYLK